ncbi:MAG: Rpn family recombination-promoting nuclease/putative transposase, partial [Planctomycetaceae bacterium]|nr:Rpn family recombination-promoting nuclease/putative transposase [Planctomycetaceae bacterium]
MKRFINPYTDFGFLRLFGDPKNKNLPIDFLNTIIPANYQIEDLTILETEN